MNVNVSRLDNELFMEQFFNKVNNSTDQIVDISMLSEPNKKKVLAVFEKFKYRCNINNVPMCVSVLVSKTAPNLEVQISVEDVADVVATDPTEEPRGDEQTKSRKAKGG